MGEVLKELNLEKHEGVFKSHNITAANLPKVSDVYLAALGVPVGARRRLQAHFGLIRPFQQHAVFEQQATKQAYYLHGNVTGSYGAAAAVAASAQAGARGALLDNPTLRAPASALNDCTNVNVPAPSAPGSHQNSHQTSGQAPSRAACSLSGRRAAGAGNPAARNANPAPKPEYASNRTTLGASATMVASSTAEPGMHCPAAAGGRQYQSSLGAGHGWPGRSTSATVMRGDAASANPCAGDNAFHAPSQSSDRLTESLTFESLYPAMDNASMTPATPRQVGSQRITSSGNCIVVRLLCPKAGAAPPVVIPSQEALRCKATRFMGCPCSMSSSSLRYL